MPQDNPPLLDKTMNTTESTPRNLADVLVSGLANIANNVKPDGSDISINVPGMSATNVDDGFSELKQSLDDLIKHITATAGSNITIDKSDILQINHTVFVDIVITTNASISVNSAMITGLPSTSISNNPLTCKAVGSSTTDYNVRIYSGNIYSSENIPNSTQLHIYGSYNRS